MMQTSRDLLSRLVVAFDRCQRRLLDIHEFSDDAACILRLQLTTARTRIELADGTVVAPGHTIGTLHLWNQQMPQIPPTGPDLAWAGKLSRSLTHSFQLLARHAAEDPDLAQVRAFSGDPSLVYSPATVRLLRRLGFELPDPPLHRGLVQRARHLIARLWAWLLRRAFNPGSLRGLAPSDLQCRPLWLSRNILIARHGAAIPVAPDR